MPTKRTELAPQRYRIKRGSVRLVSIDCRGWLESGETLTGTPTITIAPSSGTPPTLSNKAVNTGALTINGQSVGIGQALQCLVTTTSSTTVGSYTITAQCGTNATPAQTVIGDVIIDVVE
jgi:hypothetical protein